MMNKEKAIEFVKKMMVKHSEIQLEILEGAASWKRIGGYVLNHEEWKHIGYVSALAMAFDIETIECAKL